MTGPAGFRFFVDETSLGLGKMLAIAGTDVVHPGHPQPPIHPNRHTRRNWMPIVAAMNLVVIGRDKRIRTKPAELAAFRTCGLRVFWIAGKRDLSNWENLVLMVKSWDRMENIIRDCGPGPWFYAVSDGAVREFAV